VIPDEFALNRTNLRSIGRISTPYHPQFFVTTASTPLLWITGRMGHAAAIRIGYERYGLPLFTPLYVNVHTFDQAEATVKLYFDRCE